MVKNINKKLRELVEKKVKKGLSVPEIADMLEEKQEIIEGIVKSLEVGSEFSL